MKRMLNLKEIALITALTQLVAVEGNEVQFGGDIYVDGKILSDSVVKVMNVPSSTILTDKEIEQITSGTFIDGDFLGMTNPVLFPAREGETNYIGLLIGVSPTTRPTIASYLINKSTKQISIYTDKIYNLSGVYSINGKEYPAYPSSTGTFTLKCVNGALTWVADE